MHYLPHTNPYLRKAGHHSRLKKPSRCNPWSPYRTDLTLGRDGAWLSEDLHFSKILKSSPSIPSKRRYSAHAVRGKYIGKDGQRDPQSLFHYFRDGKLPEKYFATPRDIRAFIKAQPNGRRGFLLNDGSDNLFIVKGKKGEPWFVSVSWDEILWEEIHEGRDLPSHAWNVVSWPPGFMELWTDLQVIYPT